MYCKTHVMQYISIILHKKTCTFLWYRLKLTNEEICHAILTMDEQEDLPKDMLEQVPNIHTTFKHVTQ